MEIKNYLIGLVLFSGIVLGMSTFYADVAVTYNATYTNYTTFNSFNNSFAEVNEITDNLQNHTVGFTQKGMFDVTKYQDAVLAFIDIGSVLSVTPNLMVEYWNEMTVLIGIPIPWWFIVIIGAVIGIAVAFKVASIFTKMEGI